MTKFKHNAPYFSKDLFVNGIYATTEDETHSLNGLPTTCKFCYTRCTKTSSVKSQPNDRNRSINQLPHVLGSDTIIIIQTQKYYSEQKQKQ